MHFTSVFKLKISWLWTGSDWNTNSRYTRKVNGSWKFNKLYFGLRSELEDRSAQNKSLFNQTCKKILWTTHSTDIYFEHSLGSSRARPSDDWHKTGDIFADFQTKLLIYFMRKIMRIFSRHLLNIITARFFNGNKKWRGSGRYINSGSVWHYGDRGLF